MWLLLLLWIRYMCFAVEVQKKREISRTQQYPIQTYTTTLLPRVTFFLGWLSFRSFLRAPAHVLSYCDRVSADHDFCLSVHIFFSSTRGCISNANRWHARYVGTRIGSIKTHVGGLALARTHEGVSHGCVRNCQIGARRGAVGLIPASARLIPESQKRDRNVK